jgi:hypothetical protein
MLNLLNESEPTETLLENSAPKRERVENELRSDSARSDRAIGKLCGVDGKTVAAARDRLGIAEPLGNSTPSPTERRHMLIEGVKDFDARVKPESAEEAVDNAIADGKISTTGDADGYTFWPIPRQATIECREQPGGGVEIWQEGQHGGADETIIHVAAGNAVMLARHILYAAGFLTVGIYTHEKAGNVDLENGDLASNFYDEKPGYGPVR